MASGNEFIDFRLISMRKSERPQNQRSGGASMTAICAIMLVMEPFYSDHNRLDERSLALHQLVAEKVQAAPALLDKARENVRRWQQASGSVSPALAEWAQILAAPASQVVALLAERSERATRLRQSSTFAGILTEEERRAIYESYSARTYHPRRGPNLG